MQRISAALLVISGLLLFTMAGGTDAQAQGADDPAQLEAGAAVYETSCAGCHAADGSGNPGLGRPLIGIANQGDRAQHLASVVDGKGNMPAFGERLSDEEADAVVSYVRLTFVEAAAETTAAEPATELAVTGVNSTQLAVLGVAMLAGGLQLLAFTRRQDL